MKQKNGIIYFILFLTMAAGTIGIFYNYGMLTGGTDETLKINSTLKFFKDFNPFDKYSTFLPVTIILVIPFAAIMLLGYLALGVGGIEDLERLAITEAYKFVPYFRFINVIFGLVAVYVFYKICFFIFKERRISLIASYLFATSLLFAQQIHTAGAWTEQTAMLLIAFYYFLKLLERPEWRVKEYIISALLIVLNTEIEAVGILAIIPFAIVYFKKHQILFFKKIRLDDNNGKINENLNKTNMSKSCHSNILTYLNLKLFVFFAVLFSGIAFFSYFQPATFHTYFSLILKAKNLGLNQTTDGFGVFDRFFGFLQVLFAFEPLLLILGLGGALAVIFSNNPKIKSQRFFYGFFGAFFLAYYVVLGPVMGGVAERRALPLIPALAFFAAVFVENLFFRYKNRNFKKIIFAGLTLFLINPIIFDYNLLKPSSYVSARKFIYAQIPQNAKILDECSLEIDENKEVLNFIRLNAPEHLTTKRNYLLSRSEILEQQKNFFVVSERGVEEKIDKKNFEYLIVCGFERQKEEVSAILSRWSDVKKQKIYDTEEIYNQNFTLDIRSLMDYSNLKNSGIFSLFDVFYYGPRVQIFKLF